MDLMAGLESCAEQGWKRVSWAGWCLAGLWAGYIGFFAFSGDRWVPIVDGANLLFHEAGHPLVGLFSERAMVYGGTWGQLAFPVVAMVMFWRQRQTLSLGMASLWLAENGLNIGRYMADARVQELPLVGGGEHDWTEILSRWQVLPYDTVLASLLRGGCVLWMVMTLLVLWWARHLPETERG